MEENHECSLIKTNSTSFWVSTTCAPSYTSHHQTCIEDCQDGFKLELGKCKKPNKYSQRELLRRIFVDVVSNNLAETLTRCNKRYPET